MNVYHLGGDMKQWYHVDCIFETFQKARATTKIIDEPDVLEGFDKLKPEDKKQILENIKGLLKWMYIMPCIFY